MNKHEGGCTLNPARVCGICALNGSENKPIAELKAVLEDGGGLPELRIITDNCPACILAALRQFNAVIESHEDKIWPVDFDFKKELQEFWYEHNSTQAE